MNKVDLKEIEDYLEECAISDNFLYPQYQITLLIQEYKNLHSIIKEVRECIENQPSSLVQSEINIIKILDKVRNNEDN